MTFNVLAVIGPDTPPDPLYPVPGDQPNTVETERGDGTNCTTVPATLIAVYGVQPGRNRRLARLLNIKASIHITDQRVAVACSKFDKGGGFTPLGGLASGAIALTANTVSKARASSRRRGKMLVGHVRYPWLLCVGFKEKSGLLSQEVLRLGLVNPAPGESNALFVDLVIPKNLDSKEIARSIAQRAAAYQLADSENLVPEDRPRLESLVNAPPLSGVAGKVTCYWFHDTPPALMAGFQHPQ
jgi:hypothetical protein